VPTSDEIVSLLDTEKVKYEMTEQNGVKGLKIIDLSTDNSIFLPVAGYRNDNTGELNDYGNIGGYYWCSTSKTTGMVGYLYFVESIGTSATGEQKRTFGFSVCSVVE